MQKIIINADDFGMSEAFNHGVIKSYVDGVVGSTSIMINLDTAQHALSLAAGYPELFIGLHTNLILGRPCADPKEIPSLVDERGFFYPSRDYRAGKRTFVYEDVRKETIAQMERYKSLRGFYPPHIEGHAVGGEAVERAFYDIAKEYGVHTSGFDPSLELEPLAGYLKVYPVVNAAYVKMLNRGVDLSDFLEDRIGILGQFDEDVIELHFHPGYLDQFILENSSLTHGRCKDLDTLCKPELKAWLKEHEFEVISFGDLKLEKD